MKVTFQTCCGVDVHKSFLVATIIILIQVHVHKKQVCKSASVCVSADTSVTIVSCSVAAVLSVCAGDGDSEEVWSTAGAPEHAAIDIAITTASIPFIILLILIIVSPL